MNMLHLINKIIGCDRVFMMVDGPVEEFSPLGGYYKTMSHCSIGLYMVNIHSQNVVKMSHD